MSPPSAVWPLRITYTTTTQLHRKVAAMADTNTCDPEFFDDEYYWAEGERYRETTCRVCGRVIEAVRVS